MHQELVTLRPVLKTTNRKGWIAALADMTGPYKASARPAKADPAGVRGADFEDDAPEVEASAPEPAGGWRSSA